MHKNLIKFYVAEVLQESGYWRKYKVRSVPATRKSKKGILQRISDFFTSKGDVDKLVDDWLEDQLYYYDFDPTDEQVNDINAYAQSKWKKAIVRARGDVDKAKLMTTSALDKRYRKLLIASRDRDDEDEV